MPPPEATTRRELIDPALKKAGWDVNDPQRVGLEIPVDGFDPAAWQAQAEFYVGEITKRQSFRPFAFMTNGRDIYFLDAGQANKRSVAGFFSPEDLENLLYLRQNRKPLTSIPINTAITNRSYQIEAVRRVAEAFEQGQRQDTQADGDALGGSGRCWRERFCGLKNEKITLRHPLIVLLLAGAVIVGLEVMVAVKSSFWIPAARTTVVPVTATVDPTSAVPCVKISPPNARYVSELGLDGLLGTGNVKNQCDDPITDVRLWMRACDSTIPWSGISYAVVNSGVISPGQSATYHIEIPSPKQASICELKVDHAEWVK